MLLRLLQDSLLRNRRRKILAMATVAISSTLMSVLAHISMDIGNKMSKELNAVEANIRILPKSESISLSVEGINYNPLKGRSFLDEKDLFRIKRIFWANNITGLTPFLTLPIEIVGDNTGPHPLVGTYFQRQIQIDESTSFESGIRSMKPYWNIQGKVPDDSHPTDVLMGKTLAEVLHLEVGHSFQILKEGTVVTLQVTGLLSGDDTYDHTMLVPLETVQNLVGLPEGIESMMASAMSVPENALSRKARNRPDTLNIQEYDHWYCTSYVSAIAHQLEEAIPNATAKPIWHVVETKGAIIDKIQLLMIVMTLVIFIAAGLGITTIIQTSILERSWEIALMKALGGAYHHIALLFIAEAILLGGAGGVLGYLVGMGLSQIIGFDLFASTITLTPVVGPVVVTYAVAISLTGTIFGLRRIASISPARALHGRI